MTDDRSRQKVNEERREEHRPPAGQYRWCETTEVLDLALLGMRPNTRLRSLSVQHVCHLLTSQGVVPIDYVLRRHAQRWIVRIAAR